MCSLIAAAPITQQHFLGTADSKNMVWVSISACNLVTFFRAVDSVLLCTALFLLVKLGTTRKKQGFTSFSQSLGALSERVCLATTFPPLGGGEKVVPSKASHDVLGDVTSSSMGDNIQRCKQLPLASFLGTEANSQQ